MTRKTPIEYLNSYRINQAATLLRESRKKVYREGGIIKKKITRMLARA